MPYGRKCQYAHGLSDMREVQRHPKYKTQICRTFHKTGACPYGTRCTFRHQEGEKERQQQQQQKTKRQSSLPLSSSSSSSYSSSCSFAASNPMLPTSPLTTASSTPNLSTVSTSPLVNGTQRWMDDFFFLEDPAKDEFILPRPESLLPHELLVDLSEPEITVPYPMDPYVPSYDLFGYASMVKSHVQTIGK